MHAKGSGAYGTFTVTHGLTRYNASRCPFHSYHRDGAMRVDGNHGSTVGYGPNSYGEWRRQPEFSEPPLSLEGAADHWNHREDEDYYTRPGLLLRLMSAGQQSFLFANTSSAAGGSDPPHRQLPEGRSAYGKGVADALGIPLSELPTEASSPIPRR